MKKQDNVIKTKKCTKCGNPKLFSDFFKDKRGICGLKSSCKQCISKYSKLYAVKNKEKISNYNKIYRINNIVNVNIRIKDYQSKNKKKLYLKSKEYHYNKYNNDPIFRLKKLLRNRIYKILTRKCVTKKTKELLGCEFYYFKNYIEIQFLPEMNWENHGEIWEIDHKKPCSSFDLTKEEDQKQCFHFSNLQPLFKTTEIAKKFGYIDQMGNRNKKNKYEE